MITLFRLDNLRWLFQVPEAEIFILGPWDEIRTKVLQRIDIDKDELDYAHGQMLEKDHDKATFGIGHTFIFSERTNEWTTQNSAASG